MTGRTSDGFSVDQSYEFAAPKFFDFAANLKESGSIGDEPGDCDQEWFRTALLARRPSNRRQFRGGALAVRGRGDPDPASGPLP